MRRVRVRAHELTDVDVDLISLVKRPSTRIPWGIIKSQDAKGGQKMFDLAQVFARKSEAVAPVVTSVIVKGDASEALLKVLTDQGFSVEKAETAEGVTVYSQDVAYDGEVAVVKLNDTLALTVPVFKAAGSFAEMCAAQGFYPSLNIAVDLLNCELYKAVEKADTPQDAADRVTAVVSDFGTFMSSLVGALPGQVFKTEEAVAKSEGEAKAAAATEPATTEEAAAPETTQQADDVATPPVETGEHNSDAPAHESETNAIHDAAADAENPKNEPSPEVVEATDNSNLPNPDHKEGTPGIERIAKEELAEMIASAVSGAIATVQKSVDDLAGRIDGIEEGVQKTEEKLGTTVFNGVFASGRDRQPEGVEKKEEALPMIDTGFSITRRGRR